MRIYEISRSNETGNYYYDVKKEILIKTPFIPPDENRFAPPYDGLILLLSEILFFALFFSLQSERDFLYIILESLWVIVLAVKLVLQQKRFRKETEHGNAVNLSQMKREEQFKTVRAIAQGRWMYLSWNRGIAIWTFIICIWSVVTAIALLADLHFFHYCLRVEVFLMVYITYMKTSTGCSKREQICDELLRGEEFAVGRYD